MPYWIVAAASLGIFANLLIANETARLTLASLGFVVVCAGILWALLKRT